MAKKVATGKKPSSKDIPPKKKPQAGDEAGDEEEEEETEEEEEEEQETPDPKDSEDPNPKPKKKDGEENLDISSLPPETQKYIKDLRKENAKYRTKAGNLQKANEEIIGRVKKIAGGKDGEEMTPDERLAALESSSQNANFDNAVLSAALEHGVEKGQLKYFRYLIGERVADLGEGEELGEDDLAEIAEEATKTVGGKRAKTSVTDEDDDEGGGKKPKGKGKITTEQFAKMTVSEMSALQKSNPELYISLFNEARKSRRFV